MRELLMLAADGLGKIGAGIAVLTGAGSGIGEGYLVGKAL